LNIYLLLEQFYNCKVAKLRCANFFEMATEIKYLFYKLNITAKSPVSRSVIGKIKHSINLEELTKSANCYCNNNAFTYMFDNKGWARNYVSDSALEIFNCYVIDYVIQLENNNTADVFILFFGLKAEELLTPEVINKDNSIKTIINHHIMIDNNIGIHNIYHDYNIERLIDALSENRILDLRFQSSEICKTKLYDYQLDNIGWMIEIENNLPFIDFPEFKMFDMGNTLKLYFNYDKSYTDECFIPYDEMHKRQAKGGIICDETGLGKTVQMICLALSKPDINTLIIVPNHIKEHWLSEIGKHFDITIVEKYILVVSYSDFEAMDNDIITMYHRVIVDEIHELYDVKKIDENDKIFSKLMDFEHFTYRWGVSATPFVNNTAMQNLIKYIVGTKRINCAFIGYFNIILQSIRQVFRRNIKKNVSYELNLPDVVINNVLMKFNNIEQEIYDAELIGHQNSDVNFLRELCCNVLISVCNDIKNVITPKELQKLILERFMSKVLEAQNILNILIEKKQNVMHSIKNAIENCKLPNEKIILEFEQRIKHIDSNIETNTHILDRRKTVYESYKNITDNISSIMDASTDANDANDANDDTLDIDYDKMCSICFKPFSGNIALFVGCRHYFCCVCFEKCHKERPNQCPMCRTVAEIGGINFIGNDTRQFTSTKNTEILRLINTTGEKFIIFTQFKKLIKTIIQLLYSNGINVMQYSDFATSSQDVKDNTQVIVLSSNSNASGIDLSFIHNVIIMEPFENYVYGKEIEKQIIGRVHRINQVCKVNVYRLIIRNTIEETIYSMV
jgi:SNF2 family DNA or RNA helicase